MRKIWIIARMTFRETTRRNIVLVGLVLGLVFLTVFSLGFHDIYFNLRERAAPNDAYTTMLNNESVGFLSMAGL